jgi:glycolate oxidase|uniref:FAD-binding oxidoreductase n=1 Tax=Candidatus Planktophila sp. TaxID=2175601 RepID=UPI004049D618
MEHLGGLRAALGDNASLISDPEITATYSKDQAPFAAHQPAALVLLAKSTEEVSQAVTYANTYGIPVVARGAGSGLSGGANATSSSLVISLEKMNSIIDIDETNMIARVQAGVINLDLDKAAELKGLAYLPDPASRDWSTIGGNAATNAGGMCCVKYGVTSAHVRALTVVMADGQIVNLGSATKKAVTTLDLTRLMIGSEGTLGIITELVVGLAVRPDTPATIIATFPHIKSAAAAAAALLKFKPSMLEIIDQTTLKAVESWHPLGFEIAGSVLLMQLDEDQDRADEVLKLCESFEMIDGAASTDAADAVEFIRVRKLAYPALERLGATLLDDVAVPISKIAELVERVEALSTKYDLTIGIFGHAGDGNMHPTIVHDHGDLKAQERAIAAFGEIVEIAQSLGGTASGEHGIGSIKQGFAAAELSPAVIELQRAIKKAFDPKGILNPGKKLP